MSITNFPGGVLHGNQEEKTSNYTVVAVTDSGKTFTVDSDVTFTLPAIAIGEVYTFVYTGPDGSATLTISPQAADGVTYAGSSTDDKDLILASSTAKKGDFVKLAALDGTVAWQVVEARGVWTKEP